MDDERRVPVVLHIAADYKCDHNPHGTTAIPELLACTSDLARHTVISIRRTANPFNVALRRGVDVAWEYTYFGLPFGIFIGSCLSMAARQLLRHAGDDLKRASIVHAHKLSCEALIAASCLRNDQQFAISIRGSSDVKVARYQPLARAMMRKALLRAQSVLWVSAWARDPFERLRLRCRPNARVSLFPNAFEATTSIRSHHSHPADGPVRLCTILRLDHFKLKGIPNLLSALAKARGAGWDMQLDILGGGAARKVAQVRDRIAVLGLSQCVRLLGPLARTDVLGRLGTYDAMVLPSRHETFGLAYLEALSVGVPVLYSLDTGVDGYLPPASGSVGALARSVGSITDALVRIAENRRALRAEAAAYWLATGAAFFSRAQTRERYAHFVLRSLQT